jgi:hypothetical protein
MKKILPAVGLAAVLAFAAGALATGQQQKEPAEKPDIVTLTGCIERGEEPGTFRLTHVTGLPKPTGDPETEGTAGVTTTFWLDEVDELEIDLEEHIGHTAEVSGRIAPIVEGEEPARTDPTQLEKREAHRLKVTSVRHISPTCER